MEHFCSRNIGKSMKEYRNPRQFYLESQNKNNQRWYSWVRRWNSHQFNDSNAIDFNKKKEIKTQLDFYGFFVGFEKRKVHQNQKLKDFQCLWFDFNGAVDEMIQFMMDSKFLLLLIQFYFFILDFSRCFRFFKTERKHKMQRNRL
jgi:hypothetical protein